MTDIFDGVSDRVVELGQEAGSLMIFRGRLSVHRVNSVGPTRQPRAIAHLQLRHRARNGVPRASAGDVQESIGQHSTALWERSWSQPS